jgi:hypothetical protein
MIARRPADIQGLVSATFEANRRFQTDREAVLKTMRGEARPFLEQHFEIPDDGWFERQYAYLADELSDLPVPELEGLINAIRIQVEQESHLRDFNPLLMWDLTFAREALRSQAR